MALIWLPPLPDHPKGRHPAPVRLPGRRQPHRRRQGHPPDPLRRRPPPRSPPPWPPHAGRPAPRAVSALRRRRLHPPLPPRRRHGRHHPCLARARAARLSMSRLTAMLQRVALAAGSVWLPLALAPTLQRWSWGRRSASRRAGYLVVPWSRSSSFATRARKLCFRMRCAGSGGEAPSAMEQGSGT